MVTILKINLLTYCRSLLQTKGYLFFFYCFYWWQFMECFLTTPRGAGQHVGVGDGFRRSCMHGDVWQRHHHLDMVVVEDGDPFAEGWAMEWVEAYKRRKIEQKKGEERKARRESFLDIEVFEVEVGKRREWAGEEQREEVFSEGGRAKQKERNEVGLLWFWCKLRRRSRETWSPASSAGGEHFRVRLLDHILIAVDFLWFAVTVL